LSILGGWRTRYRGVEEGERHHRHRPSRPRLSYTLAAPVDPSGKLIDGREFKNMHDLKAILAANPRQLARNPAPPVHRLCHRNARAIFGSP